MRSRLNGVVVLLAILLGLSTLAFGAWKSAAWKYSPSDLSDANCVQTAIDELDARLDYIGATNATTPQVAAGSISGRVAVANLATNVLSAPQGYAMRVAYYSVTAAAPQATVSGFASIFGAWPTWQGTGVTNIVNPSYFTVGVTNVTVVPGCSQTNPIQVLVVGI